MRTSPLICLVLLALLPAFAGAEDDERGERHGGAALRPAVVDATWAKECSACHIPYAPGFLPAASWRLVMAGLDKHFGTDASLTAPEATAITAFLVANGSARWAGVDTPLRITETQGFKRKHNPKEISTAIWRRASVKSQANCAACHPRADQADFNERAIKIPI